MQKLEEYKKIMADLGLEEEKEGKANAGKKEAKLALGHVRKVIKIDKDIGKISKEALMLITRATVG